MADIAVHSFFALVYELHDLSQVCSAGCSIGTPGTVAQVKHCSSVGYLFWGATLIVRAHLENIPF